MAKGKKMMGKGKMADKPMDGKKGGKKMMPPAKKK
jgi:hypothetical protein